MSNHDVAKGGKDKETTETNKYSQDRINLKSRSFLTGFDRASHQPKLVDK